MQLYGQNLCVVIILVIKPLNTHAKIHVSSQNNIILAFGRLTALLPANQKPHSKIFGN